MTRTRILLADDHKEMRDRVVRLLNRTLTWSGGADGRALLEEASMKPMCA